MSDPVDIGDGQPAEYRDGECNGDYDCTAAKHIHGCLSDDGNNCDHPDEHAPFPRGSV